MLGLLVSVGGVLFVKVRGQLLRMINWFIIKDDTLIVRLWWLVVQTFNGAPEFSGTWRTVVQVFCPFLFAMVLYLLVDVVVLVIKSGVTWVVLLNIISNLNQSRNL